MRTHIALEIHSKQQMTALSFWIPGATFKLKKTENTHMMNILTLILVLLIVIYFFVSKIKRDREIIVHDKTTDWTDYFQKEEIPELKINEADNYALLRMDISLEPRKFAAARESLQQGVVIRNLHTNNQYEVVQFGLPSHYELSEDKTRFIHTNRPSPKYILLKIRPYLPVQLIRIQVINGGQEIAIRPVPDYSAYLQKVVTQISYSNQIAQQTKDDLINVLSSLGQGVNLPRTQIQPMSELLEANQGTISLLSLLVTILQSFKA